MTPLQRAAFYCDIGPHDEKGGLSSILANLVKSTKAPPDYTIHIATSNLTKDCRNGPTIKPWGFLGQRGFSLPIILRSALLLLDWLRFSLLPTQYKQNRQTQRVCVLVGADWTSLLRGLIVANKMGCTQKSVYVVDNIYELSRYKTGFLTPIVKNGSPTYSSNTIGTLPLPLV